MIISGHYRYLVTDAYLYPFQKNIKNAIYSNTKSIISILIGIALDKGYIKSVQQPILEFFPEKTIAHLNKQKQTITLEHVLTMSSGLYTNDSEWIETGEMMASADWVQYLLDRPVVRTPGKSFEYSNGGSYLLSAILQKTTKMNVLEFAKKYLFTPLGITDLEWRIVSPQGVNMGANGLHLTPHDRAKIGLLYLNKGHWEDKQIVSKAWIEVSTRKHISGTFARGYGYQWLIDYKYYMASGAAGQFIFVIPEKQMVVVFTSHLEKNWKIPKRLLDQYIIPATISSQSLDVQPKKKEQLDSLLASFTKAPSQGFTWVSQNGVAKNGEFIHNASPFFRFNYPKTSFQQATRFPSEIMNMKTRNEGELAVALNEIPPNIKLGEVGPKVFAKLLMKIGSKIQVLAHKKILLEDGTVAYRTDFNWNWQQTYFNLNTLLVSAFKEGKWVALIYSLPKMDFREASSSNNLNEGISIVESLTFK